MPVWGLKWWQRSAVTTEGDFMSKAKSSKPVANKQRKSATRPASASKRSVKKSTPVAVSKKSITRTQGKIEKNHRHAAATEWRQHRRPFQGDKLAGAFGARRYVRDDQEEAWAECHVRKEGHGPAVSHR
jgi:hypothetical protein